MKTLIALFLLLLPAATAAGQEIAGDWQGTLTAGPAELRLVLHVTGNAGTGYRATMDSPDQNVTGMPVEAVSRDYGSGRSLEQCLKGDRARAVTRLAARATGRCPLPQGLTKLANEISSNPNTENSRGRS